MHSIIVFASGKGSNAAAIIDYFRNTGIAKVALIVSNRADAGVLDIAKKEHVPFLIVDRQTFREQLIIDQMQSYSPSLIVLAGFLWKIPDTVINAFPNRIINIHPALLPKYGGKGMYGQHVHEAVLAAKEVRSGITIHYVDGKYDNGDVILQASCPVGEQDTVATLAQKVHRLEHYFFPRTVEYLLQRQ